MSGPSSNYDPVEVTPLSPEEVTRMRDEAIAAISAAGDLVAHGHEHVGQRGQGHGQLQISQASNLKVTEVAARCGPRRRPRV